MTLIDYLRAEGITFGAFAAQIAETENIVRKWAYRQRQPSLPNALKIETATGGKVLPRDLALRTEASAAEAE